MNNIKTLWIAALMLTAGAANANQTATISPLHSAADLPFTITVSRAAITLPAGIHSGAYAVHNGRWLFIAGRTNGMHGFGSDPFPPEKQNTTVYVVDPVREVIYSRDLDDATSGLTQQQIDTLSVTSPEYYQNQNTLYIMGGYGIDTTTGLFGTKPVLTAVDVPKMIAWVLDPGHAEPAAAAIRQTTSPWVQVTGGYLFFPNNHLSGLLVFGQNFTGVYTPSSNGDYTRQVRRLQVIDNGRDLFVQSRASEGINAAYRRRDLNVMPWMNGNQQALVALSGVFTLDTGIWTVPVEIAEDGSTYMADPDAADTFKQGMNNYVSASVTLHSPSLQDNYFLLIGGITFEYYDDNTMSFKTSPQFPFTNQITTVKRDAAGSYTQYFMDERYPVILSTGTNPGNELLIGAGAYFINSPTAPQYSNQVINIDQLSEPTVLGYIVGGIMSTVPNTSSQADSTASPYVFAVTLNPR